MSKKELKIFGAFRTGSNLVRGLLELNFDVLVHNNNYAYKHIPIPADFKDNEYKPFPIKLVSTVKDPFAFLDSTFRYCEKKNFLNIDAGRTFDEFCHKRFIVFDGGFKGFPRYRFANPIQYWNSLYHNLLSLPEQQNIVVRYEDLLEDMEGEILKIGEKYELGLKKKEFVFATGVTINLGDPKRSSPNDYFQDHQFERKEYYLERQYMERFSDEQKDFIYSELDQDLMQVLCYPLCSSVLESKANKDSIVKDLQHQVVLGQGEILKLEASLTVESEALMEKVQKLKWNRAKVIRLEKSLVEEKTARTEESKRLSDTLRVANHKIVSLEKNIKVDSKRANQKQMVLENELRHLKVELKQNRKQLDKVRVSYWDIRKSFSFKLGNDLVNAVAKPGKNTFMLPLRVYRNLKYRLSRSKPS